MMEVVKLPVAPLRNCAEMLRRLADEIDAGPCPEGADVVVVLSAGDFSVRYYGSSPLPDATTAQMLAAGVAEMADGYRANHTLPS